MMNTFGDKVNKVEKFDEELRNIGFTNAEIEKIKTAMKVLREFYEKKGKIDEYESFEDNFMLFARTYCKVCSPWKKKHVVKGITAAINYKINGFDNISLFNTFQTQLERNMFINKWNSFFSSFGLGIEAFSYSGKAGYKFINDSFSLKFEELTQNGLNDPLQVYAILTNTYMIDVAIRTLEREFMEEYNKNGGLLYIGNIAEKGTSWVTSKIKKGLKEIGIDDKGLIMGKPAREYYFEKVKKALDEYKKLKEELLNLTENIFYNKNTLDVEINQTKDERIQEIFKRMKEIVGIIKNSLIELRINNSYMGIAFNVIDTFDIAFILTGPTALIKKGFKKAAKELVEKIIKVGFKGFLRRWGFASLSTFGFLFLYENLSEEYGKNLMKIFSQNTKMYDMIRTELEKEGVKLEDVDAYLNGDENKLSLEQKIALATAFSLAAVVVPAHTRHANGDNIMPLLKSILLFDPPAKKTYKLFYSIRGVIKSLEQIRRGLPNNKILFEKKVRELLQKMKDARIKNLIEEIIYSGKYLSEEENVKKFKKYLRYEIVKPLIRIWGDDESARILLNTAEHKFNLLEIYKKGGKYEEALHEFFNLLQTLFGREVMRIEERIKKLNKIIYEIFNKEFIGHLNKIRNKVDRILKETKKKRELLIKKGADTTQIDNEIEKLEGSMESLNLLIETKNIMEEFRRSGGNFNISNFVDYLMDVKYAFLDVLSLNLSDENSMGLLSRVKENFDSIEKLINGISSEYSDFINNPIFMYVMLETKGEGVEDFVNISYNAIKRQEGGWAEVGRYFDELKRVKIYNEKPQVIKSVNGSATCIAFNIDDAESVDITPENLKFLKDVNLGVDKVTMSNPHFLERIENPISIAMSNPKAFSKVGYDNTLVMDRMGRKVDLFRRIRAYGVKLEIKNKNPIYLPLFEAKIDFKGKAYRVYLTIYPKEEKVYIIGIQPKNKQKLKNIKIVIQ